MGCMKVEVVRLPVSGLQRRNAIAPGIVVLLAGGEVVQRRQSQEVQRTDVRRSGAVLPVARELRVEGRHDRKVLLRRNETGVGQLGACSSYVLRELLLRVGVQGQGKVVFTQHEIA